MPDQFGFIGLGQMGGPMAANIAAGGASLAVYDKAGTADMAPDGAAICDSLEEVLGRAETVFLSLPDGPVSLAVARQIADAPKHTTTLVVDLSTIGPDAAREAHGILATAGIDYVDAPVSGGAAGAKAGTITIMWAGSGEQLTRHANVMKSFSKNQFHVGDVAGQGQSLKILNNFLSGTAMAATSEAILYGLSQGLDMKVMLDVVNASTGQNTASSDKFPKRILTKTFDAGFKTALLAKDVRLFLKNARIAGTPDKISSLISGIWNGCDEALPDSDFTRVYQFIHDQKE